MDSRRRKQSTRKQQGMERLRQRLNDQQSGDPLFPDPVDCLDISQLRSELQECLTILRVASLTAAQREEVMQRRQILQDTLLLGEIRRHSAAAQECSWRGTQDALGALGGNLQMLNRLREQGAIAIQYVDGTWTIWPTTAGPA